MSTLPPPGKISADTHDSDGLSKLKRLGRDFTKLNLFFLEVSFEETKLEIFSSVQSYNSETTVFYKKCIKSLADSCKSQDVNWSTVAYLEQMSAKFNYTLIVNTVKSLNHSEKLDTSA